MQRTFIAIALALTLSCACATYIQTQNYVKGPTQVIADNETNYTNATNGNSIQLASINAGELDIIATTYVANSADPKNTSANSWALVYRKLDGKTLSGTANTTLNWTQPESVNYANGFVFSVATANDTATNSIPQIVVYQQAITGGNPLARLTLTNNSYVGYTPIPVGAGAIGKNYYIFYLVNNTNSTPTQVNITSFTVGSTTKGSDFNLTTGFTYTLGAKVNVAWGEALGSNQLYANWVEGTGNTSVLKYTTIDVTKGTYNATAATAYQSNYTCSAFSTDKKYYGDFCYYTTDASEGVNQTINYYIRFNGTAFVPYTNVSLNASTQGFSAVYPYGPYVAIIFKDTLTTAKNTTYSYEIFNLDSWSSSKNRTTFLTTDVAPTFFRVVSGGLYTLTYINHPDYLTNNATVHFTNIQVGLVLGSSYLTSVLGFIMTIVAGVLLF